MAAPPTPKRGPKPKPQKKAAGGAANLISSYPLVPEKSMIDVPWEALERFRAGTASGKDWFDITIRIRLNSQVAQEHYEQITFDEMRDCMRVAVQINSRQQATGRWHATGEEYEMLRAGLEAAEAIQKDTTMEQKAAAYAKVLRELKSP